MNTPASFAENGFAVVENIYTEEEIQAILKAISQADTNRGTFRKSSDLFAIRQFLKEIPEVNALVFNGKLRELLQEWMGEGYFVVKSIYFDKPQASNWYVSYHQDLTISVDRKVDLPGFGPWTVKQQQFAVQPPLEILENIFTLRLHLDHTDGQNGALKVVPGSHAKGIYRPETIDWTKESEAVCAVPKGGAMWMKPLLLHSSGRTTNGQRRRVIHLEFSSLALPEGLSWAEVA